MGGGVRKKKEGEERKRRWWWTDGRGLEVDGGQLAAGGLRELGQHAGQGPVLGLQPLFNLPQGLNLLYLGEVLQGGRRRQQPQHRRTKRERKGEGGGQKRTNVFEETNEERVNERQDNIN